MDAVKTVTLAGSIKLPVSDVELKHLTDASGNPVVVRCERVDEVVVLRSLKTLPGSRDGDAEREAELEQRAMTVEEQIAVGERLDQMAMELVPVGTALAAEGGTMVRPAFYFGDVPPYPGAVPWRMLRMEDKSALVTAILQVSGFGGGPAASTSFPVRKRGRGRGRAGAVAAGAQ